MIVIAERIAAIFLKVHSEIITDIASRRIIVNFLEAS